MSLKFRMMKSGKRNLTYFVDCARDIIADVINDKSRLKNSEKKPITFNRATRPAHTQFTFNSNVALSLTRRKHFTSCNSSIFNNYFSKLSWWPCEIEMNREISLSKRKHNNNNNNFNSHRSRSTQSKSLMNSDNWFEIAYTLNSLEYFKVFQGIESILNGQWRPISN